jgi:ATP-dependent Clp protease ATP-binding subunit ClpA
MDNYPESSCLEHISIRLPESHIRSAADEGPSTLVRIAQAIGHSGFRKRFPHVWKREREVRDLVHRLGSERANVLLVGQCGCGKTCVLVHAARMLERNRSKDDRDAPTARHRYWQTNAGRLVAGMFRPLQRETCLAILRKELTELALREGFRKLGLRLQFTQPLVEHLMQVGFDPRFGARPLQRTLEMVIVAKLARFLMDHPGLRDVAIQADIGPQCARQLSVR